MAKKNKDIEGTYVQVLHSKESSVTRERNSDDQWDQNDLRHDYSYHGLKELSSKSYYDLIVPFKLVKNKTYYLLIVSYNTGDSFHREEDCEAMIELFEDKATAEKAIAYMTGKIVPTQHQLLKLCESRQLDIKDGKISEFSSFSIDSKGDLCVIYNGTWTGYFESLNHFDIVELEVTEQDDT